MNDPAISHVLTRRAFTASALGCLVPSAFARTAVDASAPPSTGNEKLMREHGLVERVILVYERASDLLEHGKPFNQQLIGDAARIVMRSIHGMHEPEEEKYLFPRVKNDPQSGEIVATLLRQHAQGRRLTALIGGDLTPKRISDPQRVRQLVTAMRQFGTMYRAHAAYENSIVYPAFRDGESARDYASISEQFRHDERKIGEADDAKGYSMELHRIEQALGLRLADYTSRVETKG